MSHTPKEEEKRLREEFINKIELDKMIKDIGYTGAKGTIADYWLKIRREAIAEEKERVKQNIVKTIEKYEDKGDERYGLVKHNNTVLQRLEDDLLFHLTQE